jgi:hypothetical protein
MKKMIVTLFAFFTIGIAASIGNEEPNVNPKILSAFQKEFSFAQNVKWQIKGELTQVNFSVNDHGFVAWYNSAGELVSTARNLLYMQLPLSVIKTLEKDFADASLFGFVEITRDDETVYRIQAERKNKKFLLDVSPGGDVLSVKRIK